MFYVCYVFLLGLVIMLSSINKNYAVDVSGSYDAMMRMRIDDRDKLALLFPKSVDQINVWLDDAMQLAQKELTEILAIPAQQRTFNNTARALDISQHTLNRLNWMLNLVGNVYPSKEMRDAAQTARTTLQGFAVDIYFNPDLYRAFQEYVGHAGVIELLSDENRYFLQRKMEDFKRSGLHLSAETLAQIKQVEKDLAEKGQQFSKNISADVRTISVSCDDLTGVNLDFIVGLKRDGDHYLLGIDYPTYSEVMQKCQVSATRRSLFLAFNNRAYPENHGLLVELTQKRDKLAKLLGYKNFAEREIADSMARSVDKVEMFLSDLVEASFKKAKKEFAQLTADLPKGVSCNADGSLNPWDYGYVCDHYKRKHFDINESKIAEYFPVQKVLDGIFTIYQNFLGLRFQEVKPDWSWHEDVRLIEVYRGSSDEFLGHLFLDLYPRPYKYTHACHSYLIRSFQSAGSNIPMVSVVIANFPKPTDDKPALLKHADVTTFFHEFGHAMHAVLGRTEHAGFSGTSVMRDYVEMPSQMFEEWMLEPEALRLVSSHYQTGELMPNEIIQKKVELKKFESGYFVLRQCMLSLLSLYLAQNKALSEDPGALWQLLEKQYVGDFVAVDPEEHWYAAFGHLDGGGYAAKYYGYLWSKVFALDIFAQVKKQGLFNRGVGSKVQQILSAGGSVPPDKLLYDFLGREPNQEAFLADFGL